MSGPARRGVGPTLLAVDDNELVLRVVVDHFEPRGWRVLTARGAKEALSLARRALPDAVLADVLMPEMDGWELCAAFRKIEGALEVPFVFLTVEADVPKRIRGFRAGADDYVTKPFAVEEVQVRVERLLARRAATAAARESGEALLAGSVEHLAISDLLQILSLNGKDGTVRLRDGVSHGAIEFEAGRIVHAEEGRSVGLKALYRMLGWARAEFRVLAREGPSPARTIEAPPTNVLMDGLVALDEWARIRESLPPPAAILRVADDARARLDGRSVTPAEYAVLSRARGGATVGSILEESPFPDAVVGAALSDLLASGVLRPAS